MIAPTPRPRPGAGTGVVLSLATALLLTAGAPTPAPLPDLNEKVVAFARANLGKCVGDGSCTTLAIAALEAAGAKSDPFDKLGGEYTWGQPVESFKEALPGDILQFHNAVFEGKMATSKRRWISWHQEYPHHTAVVSRVIERGNVVAVPHQNVTVQGKEGKDARNVLEGTLRIDSLQEGGWVRIYRPVARSVHRRESPAPSPGEDADRDSAGGFDP